MWKRAENPPGARSVAYFWATWLCDSLLTKRKTVNPPQNWEAGWRVSKQKNNLGSFARCFSSVGIFDATANILDTPTAILAAASGRQILDVTRKRTLSVTLAGRRGSGRCWRNCTGRLPRHAHTPRNQTKLTAARYKHNQPTSHTACTHNKGPQS